MNSSPPNSARIDDSAAATQDSPETMAHRLARCEAMVSELRGDLLALVPELSRRSCEVVAAAVGAEPRLLWLRAFLRAFPAASLREICAAARGAGHRFTLSRVNGLLRRHPWIGPPENDSA